MKKLIALLAMFAMGSAAMAAELTYDNSVAGEATVSIPDGALGIALDVAVNTGTLDAVTVNGFNVFIDEASEMATLPAALPIGTNPIANINDAGSAALSSNFALCAGYLAANNPGTVGANIVLEAAGGAQVTITANAKRGAGIVAASGEIAFDATTIDIAAESTCHFSEGDANCDGAVSAGDISIVLNYWGTSDPAGDINGDGSVSAGDISVILANWGSTF